MTLSKMLTIHVLWWMEQVAGFPKAAVYWYRSWWLANISLADAGRPGLDIAPPDAAAGVAAAPASATSAGALRTVGGAGGRSDPTTTFVHIVENPVKVWSTDGEAGSPLSKEFIGRSVHVYTNAPFVRLTCSGAAPASEVKHVEHLGYATFNVTADSVCSKSPKWTAEALSEDQTTVLATDVASRAGDAVSLKLSLDAPTPRTGTGSALFLDGVDVALIRAEVLDNDGVVVYTSDVEVVFTVVSGPGLLLGTANGNPADHVAMKSPKRRAYHGLARAIVRASVDASGSAEDRALRKLVNVDAGAGAKSAAVAGGTAAQLRSVVEDVVVKACAASLPCAQLTIPTSADAGDSPFEVAARSVGLADIGS